MDAHAATQDRPLAQAPAADDSSLVMSMLEDHGFEPRSHGNSALLKSGLETFLQSLLRSPRVSRIDAAAVDEVIAAIDAKISAQVNAIMHNEAFQTLESRWRGLKYAIDQIDFRENIRVEVLNVSKEELLEDFEDAPEIVKSGLYKHVYSDNIGTFGGKPIGFICAEYEFGYGPQDLKLLGKCAAVSAMAHAPFIANAGAGMFGCEDYDEFTRLKDLKQIFEQDEYAKWRSFRESEDARYVGLCAPRFLLRLPYGQDTVRARDFNFEEDVEGKAEHYLWGPASVAMTSRLADSFAQYRWCPNIIGPKAGGLVEDLPLHQYRAMGELQTRCPLETVLTDRRSFELSEEGFIPLEFEKETDRACFFAANSCQAPKTFGISKEGRAAEANYRLGTQLPYVFIVSRIAHYLKVMQKNEIGTWKERADLERELNRWINQYVVNMDNPDPVTRSRKPLREAKVTVSDVPGQPGWYRCGIQLRPHFKMVGADITLSLVGKLDKE